MTGLSNLSSCKPKNWSTHSFAIQWWFANMHTASPPPPHPHTHRQINSQPSATSWCCEGLALSLEEWSCWQDRTYQNLLPLSMDDPSSWLHPESLWQSCLVQEHSRLHVPRQRIQRCSCQFARWQCQAQPRGGENCIPLGSESYNVEMYDTYLVSSKTPVDVLSWTYQSPEWRLSWQTSGQNNNHTWLAPWKIWKLRTQTMGTKPRTSNHSPPGGERCRKRNHLMTFFERTWKAHRQTYQHWNSFKGNAGETSERQCPAHVGFSKHIGAICKYKSTELSGIFQLKFLQPQV